MKKTASIFYWLLCVFLGFWVLISTNHELAAELGLASGPGRPTNIVSTDHVENQEDIPESTAVELPKNYIGEFPSDDELRDFFTVYCNAYEKYPNPEDALYCGRADNYVLVFFPGMGVHITLYEFSYADGYIQITDKAHGDVAGSGGLSINHTEHNGKHIYYGYCSDYHWDSHKDVRIPIEWLMLTMTDEQGSIVEMNMSESLGYVCVLDEPLADFQIIDQGGNIILDYATFIDQWYIINETAF